MADLSEAIELIKKYEGFNEKAYPDPDTGSYPYTIGFGSQFYPDGSQVKAGHRCSRKKALEYLEYEVHVIDDQLTCLELPMTHNMRLALISFIHSVGWQAFLYSHIVDAMEISDYAYTIDLISQWIFDNNHKVIGGLIERRREEAQLFLDGSQVKDGTNSILLKAFTAYSGSPTQITAIKNLESHMNPYTLSEFINSFCLSDKEVWMEYPSSDFDEIITLRV